MAEDPQEKTKNSEAKTSKSWLFYTKTIASKSGGIWWVILAVIMVAVIFLILILSSKGLLGNGVSSSSLSSFSSNT